MTKDTEFKKTMDARDWEEGLNDVLVKHGEQPVDPGLLIGWFANAIMFGYDEGVKKSSAIDTENARLRECLEELTHQAHNEGNGEYTIPAWFYNKAKQALSRKE